MTAALMEPDGFFRLVRPGAERRRADAARALADEAVRGERCGADAAFRRLPVQAGPLPGAVAAAARGGLAHAVRGGVR